MMVFITVWKENSLKLMLCDRYREMENGIERGGMARVCALLVYNIGSSSMPRYVA